jgi:hypothetical protein
MRIAKAFRVRKMPRLALALSLALALALAACGGGGEATTVEAGAPTEAGDTAALKKLITDYGLIDDPVEGCKLYSLQYLATLGGVKGCQEQDWAVKQLTIDDVKLDGDTATVVFTRENGQQQSIPIVREGEPSDAYDGWKIAADPTKYAPSPDAGAQTQPPAATEPDAATNKTDTVPLGPEDMAAAYRICIERRGAEDVKEDDSPLPTVDFSGGGSRVIASFGNSPQDAEQGLAVVRKRKPFFSDRLGTAVLYSVADPLAHDLDTGLACLKEIGQG